MKIVHLAAGAGSMYCGACAHDALLVSELRRMGEDAVVYPLYTPLKLDGEFAFPQREIHLGGVKAYLQHKSRFFRAIPERWVGWLDNEKLLHWASKFAVSTKPTELGPMTLDTLNGSLGPMAKEFERLADAVALEEPDIVTITNSMLSGVAPLLKVKAATPIVCFFQGEDSFLEALPLFYKEACIEQIRQNSACIDLFIAPCEDHREKMLELLACDPGKVRVVRTGVDTNAIPTAERRKEGEPFTVGYLSSILPGKGLDLLIEATRGHDIRLLVAGKVLDKKYFQSLDKRQFEYLGELSPTDKAAFYGKIDVFCLPSRIRESRGIAVLEALANGVPAVVPDKGVFKEIHALTRAVALCEPESVESLRSVLTRIHGNPQLLNALRSSAREGIRMHYNAQTMAEETLELLRIVARI